ncbi:MAG: hypothetical protein AAFQ82_19695, partial [Myxococcota bacterium]
MQRTVLLPLALLTACQSSVRPEPSSQANPSIRFHVSYSEPVRSAPIDGRLLVLMAPNDGSTSEPRDRVSAGTQAIQLFGKNVDGLDPDEVAIVDATAFGYPHRSLAEVPPGEYVVQALVNEYETFELATGHTVKLPPDRGEGQKWNRKPGNLYSTPVVVTLEAGSDATIELRLDNVLPPVEAPQDTSYVRHVKMRSPSLSEFWGRDIYLGA